MTPRRFTVRETREAVQVTADNLTEVAEWSRGQVYAGRAVLTGRADRHGGATLVHPGDYLVTDGTRWWDVSAEEFERESAGWEEQG